MFDKVLILSASAGAGHIRAAQAIESAFALAQAAREVLHVDTLDYTNKLFRNLYSRAYIDMVNKAPEMLGWLYDHLDKPWKNERRRLAFDKLNTRPFVKMLKAYQPEMVVCTHFLPAEIISWLKAKERINTRQAIVVTDFDVHAMWLCHHYEQYFVALDETREHLMQLGIPASKLTVSGIPIDPVFNAPKDRREMRDKLALKQNRITILVSAGGFGVGPIEHLLASLLQLKHPAQAIVFCGRNEELKARVERLTKTTEARGGQAEVRALGYTTLMDEYMAAADIVLGKPGGLTTSEALARGLAFVIVNPIPGQEERNSDHLLEEGIAIRCNNLPVLAYKIDKLLDDPTRLAAMKANALRLAHPRAAHDIVSRLLALKG
ncbi:MAG TPA: glycosyltransferase [Pyrinomonadaceae bacterium]|jgi:processive 1,2-diacylglycerol beta-glucosyltransferase|nr:glycosyltransferase [Pyrinomonadaceae bacterium]